MKNIITKRNTKIIGGILITTILSGVGSSLNTVLAGPCTNHRARRKPHCMRFPSTIRSIPGNQNSEIIVGKSDKTHLRYKMKEDLGLPLLKGPKNPLNMGVRDRTDSPNFVDQLERHWNYTVWETNEGKYNLYNENGEQWGICNPMFISGSARNHISKYNFSNLQLNYKDFINMTYLGQNNSMGSTYNYIFYIPYRVINGVEQKSLNMVTSNGHLNGSLDRNDISFKFTFY